MTTTHVDAVQNQLCTRIEELEAEKLALLEENTALAAHVERLCRAAYEVCNDSFSYGGTSRVVDAAGDLATGDKGKYPCSMTALAEAAIEEHTDSLARLKAKWQAEALQELYNSWKGEGMIRRGALLDKAIELEEEAEGGEA